MVEKVFELKSNGISISEISRVVGISRDRVYKILNNKIGSISLDGLNIKLTDLQKQLIIGSTLGDANIRCRKGRAHVRFMHSKSQIDYLNFKYEILKNVSGKLTENKRTYKLSNGENYYDVGFSVRTMAQIKEYYDLFYDELGIKRFKSELSELINDFSVAIWFMDDGWISKHKYYYIATNSFDDESKENIKQMFKIKFDIDVSFDKKSQLRIAASSTCKFEGIIKPFIIESMKYKLRPAVLDKLG